MMKQLAILAAIASVSLGADLPTASDLEGEGRRLNDDVSFEDNVYLYSSGICTGTKTEAGKLFSRCSLGRCRGFIGAKIPKGKDLIVNTSHFVYGR